jgi:hypothetical protein
MDIHPMYEVLREIGHDELVTVYRTPDLPLIRSGGIKELGDRSRRDKRRMERSSSQA